MFNLIYGLIVGAALVAIAWGLATRYPQPEPDPDVPSVAKSLTIERTVNGAPVLRLDGKPLPWMTTDGVDVEKVAKGLYLLHVSIYIDTEAPL